MVSLGMRVRICSIRASLSIVGSRRVAGAEVLRSPGRRTTVLSAAPGLRSTSAPATRSLSHSPGLGPQGRSAEVRHGDAVIALDVKALAAVGDRADQDRLPGAIVVARIGLRRLLVNVTVQWNEIEHAGREAAYLAAFLPGHVASHRQRLEINFRSHDGRAEVERDAAFE